MDDERLVIEVDIAEALERIKQGQGAPEELIDSDPLLPDFRVRFGALA